MYLVSIFGCFFNIIFIACFARILPKNILFRFVLFSLFVSLLSAVVIFYEVIVLRTICIVPLAPWVEISFLKVDWALLFDSVSVTLLFVVLFISFLVHLYSLEYMAGDPHIIRFIFSLSLFTFFMLLMATANNALQLFLGWEGVGLASYILINFWYSRSEANKSAIKAMVVNRIGDFGLYFSILLLLFSFKSLNFGVIFALCPYYENLVLDVFGFEVGILPLIASFIFLGTMGKSAQLGLHLWLPDAMEGPTPVSALLHAATMVTAGVFVLIRFSRLFEYAPGVLFFVAILGSLTTLFAGAFACIQTDIKKIIAYSTCSHLGIMLLICGFSQYNAALYHLLNHAFFKALLFLGAGSVIHALSDEQDSRKMGGLVIVMPFTYLSFLVGSLSLIGFPFLSGYFSKDFIWESVFTNFYGFKYLQQLDVWACGNGFFPFLYYKYMLFVFTAILVLSVLYSFRLVILVFSLDYNGYKSNIRYVHEPSLFMFLPLLVLCLMSIFGGYIFKDMFVGLGLSNWQVLPDVFSSKDGLREYLFSSDIWSWAKFGRKTFTFFLSLFSLLVLVCFYVVFFGKPNINYLVVAFDYISWYFSYFVLNIYSLVYTLFFYCVKKLNNFFGLSFVVSKSLMVLLVFGLFVVFWFFFGFAFFILVLLYLSFFVLVFAKPLSNFSNIFHYFSKIFNNKKIYKSFVRFLNSDHFLYRWVSKTVLFSSYHITFKSIDRGLLEFFGPFGFVNILNKLWKGTGIFGIFLSFLFFVLFCTILVFVLAFFSFNDIVFVVFLIIALSFLYDTK